MRDLTVLLDGTTAGLFLGFGLALLVALAFVPVDPTLTLIAGCILAAGVVLFAHAYLSYR